MSEANAPRIIANDAAILARRYANALYELAEEQKQLDTVAADLRGLKGLLHDSLEFQQVVDHPRLSRVQLLAAMKQVAVSAKLNNLTGNFLALLAQNRRLAYLDVIVDAFMAHLAVRRGEYTAEIRAAKALTQKQQDQLATQLQQLAGGKIHMIIKEDASLLGGLIVKLGSRLIDASLKGKLARFERALKSQREAA